MFSLGEKQAPVVVTCNSRFLARVSQHVLIERLFRAARLSALSALMQRHVQRVLQSTMRVIVCLARERFVTRRTRDDGVVIVNVLLHVLFFSEIHKRQLLLVNAFISYHLNANTLPTRLTLQKQRPSGTTHLEAMMVLPHVSQTHV